MTLDELGAALKALPDSPRLCVVMNPKTWQDMWPEGCKGDINHGIAGRILMRYRVFVDCYVPAGEYRFKPDPDCQGAPALEDDIPWSSWMSRGVG